MNVTKEGLRIDDCQPDDIITVLTKNGTEYTIRVVNPEECTGTVVGGNHSPQPYPAFILCMYLDSGLRFWPVDGDGQTITSEILELRLNGELVE